MQRFPTVTPSKILVRIFHTANRSALSPRPWQTVDAEHRADGRFDDPNGLEGQSDDPQKHARYRLIYSASTYTGALRESLQDFSPAPGFTAAVADIIDNDDPNIAETRLPTYDESYGVVPQSWFETRRAGEIIVDKATVVDTTPVEFCDALAREDVARITPDLLVGTNRAFTKPLGVYFFGAPERFDGLAYRSHLNLGEVAYAFYTVDGDSEALRATLGRGAEREIDPASLDVGDVINSLRLRIAGDRGATSVSELLEDARAGESEVT